MSQPNFNTQEGFSAVELLITLFIASIFLFAGYQLYTQVIKDGADADKTARMSNLVYERMRKAAGVASSGSPSGCSDSSESTTTETPTVSGFRNVVLTVRIDCPLGTAAADVTGVFLVSVTAAYNDGTSDKVLKHATYTN